MASSDGMTGWIVRDTNWSRAGLLIAAVLTFLSPFLRRGLGMGPFSVFAQLPIYMIHQYEEHGHGALKEYGNRELLRHRGRLTDGNIFVINMVGVWGVDLAALYLACYRKPAAGLVAPYLSMLNGMIHLGAALRTRRYNPGAWSAGLLLLPAGTYSAVTITRTAPTSVRDHLRAFAGAVVLHLITILIIVSNRPAPREGEAG